MIRQFYLGLLLAATILLLAACSHTPLKLNSMAPPLYIAPRVYVQSISHAILSFRSPHESFTADNLRRAESYLRDLGFVTVPESEVSAVTGGESPSFSQLESANWANARALGKALYADYVLVYKRLNDNTETSHTAYLINTITGTVHESGYRLTSPSDRSSSSAEFDRRKDEVFYELFSPKIQEEMRLIAIATKSASFSDRVASAGSPKAPPALIPQEANVADKKPAVPAGSFLKPSPVTPAEPVAVPSAPAIVITSPDISRGLRVTAKGESITVIGRATDGSGVARVLVNGEQAALDAEGNFSSDVLLKVGENQIAVTATNTQKISSTERIVVNREAGQAVRVKAATQPETGIGSGKYYALVIAVQDYLNPEINKLDFPVADAERVINALSSNYTFDRQNVTFLNNPNRKSIIKAFQDIKSIVTPRDNLLIFYAGHGIWLDDMQQGYWLPRDAAAANDPSDWIANSTIRDYIRAIKAKHVLLVADACFSGGIFKVRDAFSRPDASVEKIYEMPSRKAITSGSFKTVPDRSVFVEYLLKRLDENRDRFLDAQKLFVSFKEAVINNSPVSQTPLYGAIAESGDEGGDFIFVRRQ